jgi:hypothetical protein
MIRPQGDTAVALTKFPNGDWLAQGGGSRGDELLSPSVNAFSPALI